MNGLPLSSPDSFGCGFLYQLIAVRCLDFGRRQRLMVHHRLAWQPIDSRDTGETTTATAAIPGAILRVASLAIPIGVDADGKAISTESRLPTPLSTPSRHPCLGKADIGHATSVGYDERKRPRE